ncbi:MAG TPA: hypothetical protein VM223_27180 [Planctomycetota bacterium]|nr:hypothetical protein [Planctomycetota bacterium]
MPKLMPVNAGTMQPVHVQMDDGSFLHDGKKRAQFSRRAGKRVAGDPDHTRAWLAQKDHTRVSESKAKGKD